MIHADDHERVTRPSGTYIVDGMKLGDTAVKLTFPHPFDAPELAGVTVEATAFATRPGSTHPLWCDFKHPADGRWRSVLAKREWTDQPATEAKRGSFKRPR